MGNEKGVEQESFIKPCLYLFFPLPSGILSSATDYINGKRNFPVSQQNQALICHEPYLINKIPKNNTFEPLILIKTTWNIELSLGDVSPTDIKKKVYSARMPQKLLYMSLTLKLSALS